MCGQKKKQMTQNLFPLLISFRDIAKTNDATIDLIKLDFVISSTQFNKVINDRKFTSFQWNNEQQNLKAKHFKTICFQYQGQRNDIQVIANCLAFYRFMFFFFDSVL